MKAQFGHEATTSFSLWFDHHLIKHGEAYSNKTETLYHVDDNRLPDGFHRYSSPYKQWVTESGINDSAVPTYINNNGSPVYRKDPNYGYYVDFDNGGVVVTGALASSALTLTADFAVKDFNVYNTNQSEEALVIENKYESNSRFTSYLSGIAPYDQVTPAVFINNEYLENEGFAFGGEDKTTLDFKAVVFAENLYQLDGVLSLFGDSNNLAFPNINFGDHPINEYGDLKSEPYQYQDLINSNKTDLFYIERVVTTKISETMRNQISPLLYVGFVDFEVSKTRYPRAYLN